MNNHYTNVDYYNDFGKEGSRFKAGLPETLKLFEHEEIVRNIDKEITRLKNLMVDETNIINNIKNDIDDKLVEEFLPVGSELELGAINQYISNVCPMHIGEWERTSWCSFKRIK